MNSQEQDIFQAWSTASLSTDGSFLSASGLSCPASLDLREPSPPIPSPSPLMMSSQDSQESSEEPEASGSPETENPLERSAPTKTGNFCAKMVLATWSQASSMTAQMVMDHLMSMSTSSNPLLRVIVGTERHQNGGIHFHAVAEWTKSRTLRPIAFKVMGQTADVRTHKKGRGSYGDSLRRAWKYASKEDEFPLIYGEAPKEESEKCSKRTRDFTEALRIAEQEGVEQALKFLRKEQPYEAVCRLDSVRRGLEAARRATTAVVTPARQLESFRILPFLPDDWHTLYLWGPSGLGKTALARALLPDARLVRHRNQLVGADQSAGLIFDDFDVSHWPPTAVIHLVDWDETSGIDVKHSHVEIAPQTRKIFTMNVPIEDWMPEGCKEHQRDAIRRRVKCIQITERLF